MNNNEYIENNLKNKGAALVGFADLSELDFEARKGFRYGIIIAAALDPLIVSQIPSGPHMDYYNEYKNVSHLLKELGNYAVELIEAAGYKASTNLVKQDENFITPLPHKTVATRAGLGWIGKSATLISERYGNAIRINSVLTDMPFITGEPNNESKCGSCDICVKSCPGKAVKGVNWDVSKKREDIFDARACKDEVIRRGEIFNLTEGTCGVCISVCPYTQRYIKSCL